MKLGRKVLAYLLSVSMLGSMMVTGVSAEDADVDATYSTEELVEFIDADVVIEDVITVIEDDDDASTGEDGNSITRQGVDENDTGDDNNAIMTADNGIATMSVDETDNDTSNDTSYVATITDGGVFVNGYDSLDGAVGAATRGQTVTLNENVGLDSQLSITQSITLDLGGNTITSTSTSNAAIVVNASNIDVTIKNGAVKTSAIGKTIWNYVANSLTLEGLTLENTYSSSSALYCNNQSNIVTITNCNFTGVTYGIYVTVGDVTINSGTISSSTSTTSYAMYVTGGKVTIEDGEFEGYSRGIYVGAGDVTIKDGEFEAKYWAAVGLVSGTLKITGGTFDGNYYGIQQTGGTLTIEGGAFEANIYRALYLNSANAVAYVSGGTFTGGTDYDGVYVNAGTLELTGGTYSSQPSDSYIGDGYEAVSNGDGTWTVRVWTADTTSKWNESGLTITFKDTDYTTAVTTYEQINGVMTAVITVTVDNEFEADGVRDAILTQQVGTTGSTGYVYGQTDLAGVAGVYDTATKKDTETSYTSFDAVDNMNTSGDTSLTAHWPYLLEVEYKDTFGEWQSAYNGTNSSYLTVEGQLRHFLGGEVALEYGENYRFVTYDGYTFYQKVYFMSGDSNCVGTEQYKIVYQNDEEIVATVNSGDTVTSYTSLPSAISAAGSGDTVTLLDDVTLSAMLAISKNITLDLNQRTLTTNGQSWGIYVHSGGYKVTIQNGTIESTSLYTIQSMGGTLNVTNVIIIDNYATGGSSRPIVIAGDTEATIDTVTINGAGQIGIITDGTSVTTLSNSAITGTYTYGVLTISTSKLTITNTGISTTGTMAQAQQGSTLVVGNSANLVGGTRGIAVIAGDTGAPFVQVDDGAVVTGSDDGIYIQGVDDADIVATLVVNGGTITGQDTFGISGNGAQDYTNITINGGSVTSLTAQGIYHPQLGDLTINGGTISGTCGIQYCCEGTFTMTGGTIIGTAEEITWPEKDGTQADGSVNAGAALMFISRGVSGTGYQDNGDGMWATISGGTLQSINNEPIIVCLMDKIIEDDVTYYYFNDGIESDRVENALKQLNITGGTFIGARDFSIEEKAESEGVVSISGGYYSVAPDDAWLADNYAVSDTAHHTIDDADYYTINPILDKTQDFGSEEAPYATIVYGDEYFAEPTATYGEVTLTGDFTYSYGEESDLSYSEVITAIKGAELTNDASVVVSYSLACDGYFSGTVSGTITMVYSADTLAYSASGNTITVTLGNKTLGKISIVPESTLVYDGELKEAELVNTVTNLDLSDVDITYSTTPTNAGTYTASATVEGATATITFAISKAPVTVTVSGNSFEAGNYVAPTYTLTPDVGYSVAYYDENGDAVTLSNSTEAGTYTIEVTLTDSTNYYLSGTVGSVVIWEEAEPDKYDLAFEKDGDSEMTDYNVIAGTVHTLPDPTYTGYAFTGWSYNGKIYAAGAEFIQPEVGVTMTALWTVNSFNVSGTITDEDGIAVEAGTTVKLTTLLGVEAATDTTAADGSFFFAGVTMGEYYIVASKTVEGVEITTKTYIYVTGDTEVDKVMMEFSLSTSVAVAPELEKTTVSGLETMAVAAVTAEDADVDAATVSTVEIAVSVTAANDDTALTAINNSSEDVGYTMDITVDMIVDTYEITPISETPELLSFTIDLPADMQGMAYYTVLRYHDDIVDTLKTSKNSDGEYIELVYTKMTDAEGADVDVATSIIIHAKYFSTYAVTSSETVPSTSSSGGTSYYSSSVASTTNGDVSISSSRSTMNTTVTITTTPDDGYEVDTVSVTYSSGKEVSVTDNGDGTYSYKQPGASVTVTVTFVAIDDDVDVDNDNSFFIDVDDDAYYYDAVVWAVENDITSGTTDTTFSPNNTCTRAQAVTFLWRAAGEPVVDYANPFTDVDADSYYYEAVLWAVSEGITAGTSDTTFSPNATCSRSQIVTFLYRAAGEPEVTGDCDFTDVSADSYYYNAVLWAVENGITDGTSTTTFSPSNDCTRGQIVTFLYRYMG